MTKSYKLIVFDWEGTIADTLGLILHTVAREAKRLGFGEINAESARKYVYLGLDNALKKLFPHLTLQQYESLIDSVQNSTLLRSTEVCLIPRVRDCIEHLHKNSLNLAIATNRGHQSLQRALNASGLAEYFKVTRCAGQVPAKPCPQMLEEIIEIFGETPQTTLMIGDSPTDIEMAHNINVDAIGVDFYHQGTEALKDAGALAVFDDYDQVLKFLHL